MAKFASEKNATGNCDRCDFEYPLYKLRKEIDNLTKQNLRVCPECFDDDHPQNRLGRINIDENPGLRDPRPDRSAEVSRFGSSIRYDFTLSAEGWLSDPGGSGLTVTHDLSNGWLNHSWSNYTGTSYTASYNAVMDFDASEYVNVRIRFRINEVTPNSTEGWVGWFFWARDIDPIWPSFPFDAGSRLIVWERPPYSMGDQWHEVLFPMYGVANWDNRIVDLRFDFFGGVVPTTGSLDLDWVRIEKRVP
jgi:hypothetical protein